MAQPGRAASEAGIVIKTAFDVVVSATILATILPALAIVAAAIKLDSRGPVLFKADTPDRACPWVTGPAFPYRRPACVSRLPPH